MAQWAKIAMWWTFDLIFREKGDMCAVMGSFQAYYKSKHKKMTKCQISPNTGGCAQK